MYTRVTSRSYIRHRWKSGKKGRGRVANRSNVRFGSKADMCRARHICNANSTVDRIKFTCRPYRGVGDVGAVTRLIRKLSRPYSKLAKRVSDELDRARADRTGRR